MPLMIRHVLGTLQTWRILTRPAAAQSKSQSAALPARIPSVPVGGVPGGQTDAGELDLPEVQGTPHHENEATAQVETRGSEASGRDERSAAADGSEQNQG